MYDRSVGHVITGNVDIVRNKNCAIYLRKVIIT